MLQSLQYEIAAVMQAVRAEGLDVSLITIQQADGGYDAAGAPDGGYTDIPGLVLLKCQAAPPSNSSIRATEAKTLAEIMALQLKHVLLDSYYPQIAANMRAVLNGVAHDILGAESDSQSQMTRLMLQLVQV